MVINSKREICAALIAELIDLLLAHRAFEAQLLIVPQCDLTARDLLCNGTVPQEVTEKVLAVARTWLVSAGYLAVESLKDERLDALKKEAAL